MRLSVAVTAAVAMPAAFGGAALRPGPAPMAMAAVPSAASADALLRRHPARLPLAFEENRGQTDPLVHFVVRDRGMTAFVCGAETVFALHSPVPKADPGDDL